METFYTSVHQADFLARARRPLLLSRHRLASEDGLRQRRSLPRAAAPWALDSGGFNALRKNGRYLVAPRRYAEEACRYAEEIGQLRWCAVMDWMCEPFVIERTGRSVRWHQMKTVESLFELRSIAPGLPWMPVVQGWEVRDYEACVALYLRNGVDLRAEPVVGVGSVCSRQGMEDATRIVRLLAEMDIRLHLFGYKQTGLGSVLPYCVSADSAAWSRHARNNNVRLEGCTHVHREGSSYGRDVYADPRCGGSHAPGRHGPACRPAHRRGERHHRSGDPSDCRNCLRYAEAWSDGLVDMARRRAAPDEVARFWGLRRPTAAESAAWAARDPAEGDAGWERAAALRGDFEVATSRAAALAGVEIGHEIEAHFLGAPGLPCRRPAPGETAAAAGAPADPAVLDLPAAGGARSRFTPWGPTFALASGGSATLLPRGRGPLTPHAAWLHGYRLAPDFADPPWDDGGAGDAFLLWRATSAALDGRADRDPRVIALRARAALEARTASERAKIFDALREGLLDGLWTSALAERPTWGAATRPDLRAPADERRRVREGPPATDEDIAYSREEGRAAAREFAGASGRRLLDGLRARRVPQLLRHGGPRARAELRAAWRAGAAELGLALSDAAFRALLDGPRVRRRGPLGT